jgi:hypothetical protein
MTTFKVGLGTALVLWLIAGGTTSAARPLQDEGDSKKKESRKGGDDLVAVDLKITVEGMASLPDESRVQLRGLDTCDALDTVPINTEGQAKFSHVPACKVVFKILIPGPATGIVQADLGKYRGATIRIHMESSGANATILNPKP